MGRWGSILIFQLWQLATQAKPFVSIILGILQLVLFILTDICHPYRSTKVSVDSVNNFIDPFLQLINFCAPLINSFFGLEANKKQWISCFKGKLQPTRWGGKPAYGITFRSSGVIRSISSLIFCFSFFRLVSLSSMLLCK